MTTRRTRRTKKKSVPHRTTVSYQVGGGVITVEDLPASKAGPVLAAIIDVVRNLQKKYPELRTYHPTVGGYTPLEYQDDLDWTDERNRVGFRLSEPNRSK